MSTYEGEPTVGRGGLASGATVLALVIATLALVMAISQSPAHTGAAAKLTYYHLRENQGQRHMIWNATTVVRVENSSDFIAHDVTVTVDPLPDDHEFLCEESVDVSDGPASTRVASISRILPRSTVELEIRTGRVLAHSDDNDSQVWHDAPVVRQVSYQSFVVACDYTRCEANVKQRQKLLTQPTLRHRTNSESRIASSRR